MQPIRNIRNCALCNQLWPHAHPCEFPNDLWAYPVSSGVAQEESTETRGSRGRIRMHRMQLDATWCLYQEKFGLVQVIKIKPTLLIGIRRLYARFHEILFVSKKHIKFTDTDACCPGHPGRCAGWMPWLESDKSRGVRATCKWLRSIKPNTNTGTSLLHWRMRGFPEHETSCDSKYMRGRNVWRALTKLSSYL